MEGSGSTSSTKNYRHRVADLEPGLHHFRLVQVDSDGTTAKKGPVKVAIRPEGRYALQAPRPNPTEEDAQLRLSVRTEQTVSVSLYDILGQKLRTLTRTSVRPASPLPIRVDGSDLASGSYFVRVKGESFVATRKLMITQ